MSLSGAENIEVLRPALTFLRQALRYEYFHQDHPAFRSERQNFGEALLAARLLRKLRELNPTHTDEELPQAVNDLNTPAHANLLDVQLELYNKMMAASRQLPAASGDETSPENFKPPLRYFDFENPQRNEFLIVEQFQFAGAAGVRTLDAVVFVNGIPLAVLEIRSVHEHQGLQQGITHLQQLQSPQEIARLFHTVHVLAVLQKNAACCGTVAARPEDFKTWEESSFLGWEDLRVLLRQTPERENDLPTAQDILLAGVFAPQNLLALLRHGLAFVAATAGLKKKLAWCHQFQALQAGARLLTEPATTLPTRGVIVQPAGTGKSLSLFWLAGKLRQDELARQRPLLVLTECSAVIALFKNEWQARQWPIQQLPETASLTGALQHGGNETIIISRAQFHEALALQNRKKIFSPIFDAPVLLLVAEAQRSDDENFALDLERAFPQATFAAFTSFPPPARSSSDLLQNVLHDYPRRQAERQGHLVPVKLEMRLPEWRLADFGAPAEETGAPISPPQKNVLAAFIKAKNDLRLRAIAEDIFLHFNQDIAPNGNQALLVAAEAALAARYFELLAEKTPGKIFAWLPEKNTPPLRRPGARKEEREWENPEKILHAFAASPAPALLILAEPLPRHFSVPKVQAVYVDRPMTREAAWETIALTQRTSDENKTFGVMVDYWGDCNHWLARREIEAVVNAAPLADRYEESQFEELRWRRRELLGLFENYQHRERSEPWLLALAAAEKRAAFVNAWRAFTRRLDQLLPQILHEPVWQDACWYDQIRQQAAAFYFDGALAAASASPKLNRQFEEYARVRGGRKIREDASIYGQEFWQELETFETLAAKILRLLHVLYREIRRAAPGDPAYYQTREQRVQKIEIEHRLGRLDEEAAFTKLREEATLLQVDKGEHSPATNVLAFIGAVQKFWIPAEGEASAPQIPYEKLAHEVLAALAPETAVVDWLKKEDLQREMRRKIKHLLRQANCPPEVQETLMQEWMKLARARLAGEQ